MDYEYLFLGLVLGIILGSWILNKSGPKFKNDLEERPPKGPPPPPTNPRIPKMKKPSGEIR